MIRFCKCGSFDVTDTRVVEASSAAAIFLASEQQIRRERNEEKKGTVDRKAGSEVPLAFFFLTETPFLSPNNTAQVPFFANRSSRTRTIIWSNHDVNFSEEDGYLFRPGLFLSKKLWKFNLGVVSC